MNNETIDLLIWGNQLDLIHNLLNKRINYIINLLKLLINIFNKLYQNINDNSNNINISKFEEYSDIKLCFKSFTMLSNCGFNIVSIFI